MQRGAGAARNLSELWRNSSVGLHGISTSRPRRRRDPSSEAPRGERYRAGATGHTSYWAATFNVSVAVTKAGPWLYRIGFPGLAPGAAVSARVGLSHASMGGAGRNQPPAGATLGRVRRRADAIWRAALGLIRLGRDTPRDASSRRRRTLGDVSDFCDVGVVASAAPPRFIREISTSRPRPRRDGAAATHQRNIHVAAAAPRPVFGRTKTRAAFRRRRRFYTALYHVYLGPTLLSDADGGYRADGSGPLRNKGGADNPTPDAPPLKFDPRPKYSTFSLWDTYRAHAPLLALLNPELSVQAATSLLDIREATSDGDGPLPRAAPARERRASAERPRGAHRGAAAIPPRNVPSAPAAASRSAPRGRRRRPPLSQAGSCLEKRRAACRATPPRSSSRTWS